MQLSTALEVTNRVRHLVGVYCDLIDIVGSIRRGKSEVNDVDLAALVPSDKNWKAIKLTMEHGLYAKIECAGNSIIKCNVPHIVDGKKSLARVEFYRANQSNYGILKLIRTGSALHNEYLASLALSKGMRLKYSEGLTKDGKILAGSEETEVFRALGLEYVEPALREIVNGKPVWMAK